MKLTEHIKGFASSKILPRLVSLSSLLWYIAQSFQFAHNQASILDEGTYLIKGFLFATGRYSPFEPNGIMTNHMPFSFLIPGYIETIFGPSLRTGRYFSIFLGALILLAIWLLGRRLGNDWWGAGLVWIIAANPAFARVYSLAVSQVLIACMFAWTLVLVLKNPNKPWRFAMTGALAGLMLLTRINMAPVLPFLVLFVFWQFGWKSGLICMTAGFSVVAAGHAVFWPDIIQMWARWLPRSLTPFLDAWRITNAGSGSYNPVISIQDRISSLLDGLRFNFVPIIILTGLSISILQPGRWKDRFYYRSAVLLTLLTSLLVLAHMVVSLGKDYCIYCFSGYLMFFSPLIVLLLVLVSVGWEPGNSRKFAAYSGFLVIVLSTLAGLGASQEIGADLADIHTPLLLTGTFRSGTIPIWGILENGLGIAITTTRWILPTLLGFIAGLSIVLVGTLIIRLDRKMSLDFRYHFSPIVLGTLIILGVLFSPSRMLSALDQGERCDQDVLASIEDSGSHLDQLLPANSLIYWNGGPSAVPLLYIMDTHFFPAQLNDVYTFRQGGDPDILEKYGLWNAALSERWMDEADSVIFRENTFSTKWKLWLDENGFTEMPRSPSTNPCAPNHRLRIFMRNP